MPEIIVPDLDKTELYPPMLDPGVYTVRVAEPPRLADSKKGNPMLVMTYEVISGPMQIKADPSGEHNPAGRKIMDSIALAMKSRIKQLLIATGLLGRDDKTSALARGTFDSDILTGSVCQVALVPDMYNDKETRKIDKYIV